MPLAEFTSIDALWIVLSVFLIGVGIPLAILLVRLARTATRMGRLLEGLEESVPPLVTKTGGTVDRLNLQLDKVDLVTDSAVSAADSMDTAVRAVSLAVTSPVERVSALAKGISHGSSALFAGESLSTAVEAGKDAARRRRQELAEELARRDDRLALRQPVPIAEPAETGTPGEVVAEPVASAEGVAQTETAAEKPLP